MFSFQKALEALLASALIAPLALAQGPGGGPLPLQPPPAPPGNPVTAAKADLGQALFWDEQLSSTRSVACGTCHIPAAGGSDPRSTLGSERATHPGADGLFGTNDDVVGSPGVPLSRADGTYELDALFGVREQATGRKAPSTIGSGYSPSLFWDGRASGQLIDPITGGVVLPFGASLEAQVLGPPVSTAEMSHVGRDWVDVATRIAESKPLQLSPVIPAALDAWIGGRNYPQLFLEAFGTAEVTPARIAMAVATYERTLVPNQTRFDQALAGVPSLTPIERQGRQLFNALSCGSCHAGNRLTNDLFFNIGVRPVGEDLGRFDVTGTPGDRGRFKVPSLRNVELRAPYFHNGGMATLADVIDFYDRGGDFNSGTKDPRIVPLGLTQQQKNALVAFLSAPLTDGRVLAQSGPFERPLLYTETSVAPTRYGTATPGAAGIPSALIDRRAGARDEPEPDDCDGRRPWWGAGYPRVRWHRRAGWDSDRGHDELPGVVAGAFLCQRGNARRCRATGGGFGSKVLGLDLSPSSAGVSLYGQWLIVDPGSPGGLFAATEASELPLFF